MTTHFIVKPGAFVGIPNGEIVRRVAFYQPNEVVVSDFDLLNERDLVERFGPAGIVVSSASHSVWR